MCTCNQTNNAQQQLGVVFQANKPQIAGIFSKYGMNVPPTPDWAAIGTAAYGSNFATEIANAVSDFNGDTANAIVGILSSASNAAFDIAGNVIALKNTNKPTTGTTPLPGPVQTPVVQPQPAPPTEPKKILGLTPTQLALVGIVIVAVVATIFLTRSSK